MHDNAQAERRSRASQYQRFGAAISLMLMLVVMLLVGLYVILPYIPAYMLGAATPRLADAGAASRSEILGALIRAIIASKILSILLRVVGVVLVSLVILGIAARRSKQPRVSARLRLTASYALFLVIAGGVLLVGIYIVLRYIPTYPLRAPGQTGFEPAIASRQEILGALVRVSGIILAGLAVVGLAGGWILAGWILRPLQRINEAAQIAATGRLDHRIRLSGRNDEFRQLADTFDLMLERLHDAFTAQERFAANASHELRTPLTVTATLLDVARRNPEEQDYETLVERLRITNERAIRLTEALLRLADVNSINSVAQPVDLSMIVQHALDENADEAEHQELEITTDLAPAPTVGDAPLLEQLATNLIQNAVRHNQPSGSIHIATRHDGQRGNVSVRVENTGRRYTPAQAQRLSEPFLRGTGRVSRTDQKIGFGLGLALVSRITAIHEGALTIIPRDGGGLIVTATFPDRSLARIRHERRPARVSAPAPRPRPEPQRTQARA